MSVANTDKLLDRTGWEILRLLQQDARMTYAQIGKEVGLTAPGVADRIRRMEEAGLLTGYHASIDRKLLGLGLTSFVRVRVGRKPTHDFDAYLCGVPEVIEAYNVTGTDDYLIKFALRDVDHLGEVIKQIGEQAGVEETVTYVVMNTPVTHRVITDAHVHPPKE